MGAVKAMMMDIEEKFFDHVSEEDYSCDCYEEFKSNVTTDDIELRKRLNKLRLDCNKHFIPNTSVEARFNRCIIFDGRKYHSGGNYFGTDINTGRLTLVFFGKVL